MATSFVQKLRMNSIYPSDNNASNSNIGFNNYNDGYNPDEITSQLGRMQAFQVDKENRDFEHQRSMFEMQRRAHLADVASQVAREGQALQLKNSKPMDTIYKPSITDYQSGQLALRGQDLQQKSDLGQQNVDARNRQIDSSGNIQYLKGNQALSQIAARVAGQKDLQKNLFGQQDKTLDTKGTQATGLQKLKGEQDINLQGVKQTGAEKLQNTKGEQSQADITSRGEQTKQTNADKPVKDETPNQTRIKQNNIARQLVNSRPDLAPHIIIDPTNGNYTVTPPSTSRFGSAKGPTQEQFNEINQLLSGGGKDTVLKPDNTKKKQEPAVVKSKYKVTVQ